MFGNTSGGSTLGKEGNEDDATSMTGASNFRIAPPQLSLIVEHDPTWSLTQECLALPG